MKTITTNDIEQMQVLLTTKDGQYLLAQTKDVELISFIAQCCKFVKIDPNVITQESLTNIVLKGEKDDTK